MPHALADDVGVLTATLRRGRRTLLARVEGAALAAPPAASPMLEAATKPANAIRLYAGRPMAGAGERATHFGLENGVIATTGIDLRL
jgi:hypothetical protein